MITHTFADIDKTLIHTDPIPNAIEIFLEMKYFLHPSVVQSITAYRERGNQFHLVTGGRESRFRKMEDIIPYDICLIEHGCVILQSEGYHQE
ncbi:MAG: hypothetical protein QGH47_05340 [Candidatus Woesearchaeota archaeon]|jgi:hydroxymethylpyrimidine pyrophosphatase-like HAD family hydrolase|nr:hypothetical protein [Candidatus Woesearchaeota archaeon]|tara:strand:+ start:278 stop:553 length:276 start_codon:yes stop_codon:yes gene_type:complete